MRAHAPKQVTPCGVRSPLLPAPRNPIPARPRRRTTLCGLPPASMRSQGVDPSWPTPPPAASATPPARPRPSARTPPPPCSAPSTAGTTAARPATEPQTPADPSPPPRAPEHAYLPSIWWTSDVMGWDAPLGFPHVSQHRSRSDPR
ncbi:protein of unknown function [Streptomyces sp. KY75]|nr:protein of unknown function [Streptomyces sp. KY75]